jgi:hypothetical protein
MSFLDLILAIISSIFRLPLYHRIASNTPNIVPTKTIIINIRKSRSESVSTVRSVVRKEADKEIRNIEKFK